MYESHIEIGGPIAQILDGSLYSILKMKKKEIVTKRIYSPKFANVMICVIRVDKWNESVFFNLSGREVVGGDKQNTFIIISIDYILVNNNNEY